MKVSNNYCREKKNLRYSFGVGGGGRSLMSLSQFRNSFQNISQFRKDLQGSQPEGRELIDRGRWDRAKVCLVPGIFLSRTFVLLPRVNQNLYPSVNTIQFMEGEDFSTEPRLISDARNNDNKFCIRYRSTLLSIIENVIYQGN